MSDESPCAVTFAMQDESRLFVKRLASRQKRWFGAAPVLPTWQGRCSGHPLTVVHTGVGDTPPGRERLRGVLAGTEKPSYVVSGGYAGALSPALRTGDLILGENYSDPALLAAAHEVLVDLRPRVGTLVTQTTAAETVEAKAALARETGALAVDMETRWIGELCAEAGVPLLSLRVISDAADQGFPVPSRILYDPIRQRPRLVVLPCYLLTHPARIAAFVRFVRALSPARACLTHALTSLISMLPQSYRG